MSDPGPVLFDVNALVALTLTTHQHHRAAHRYLSQVTHGWATCPMTESAVIRLLLNPAVSVATRGPGEVLAVVKGFRGDPRWRLLTDTSTLASPMIDTTVLMGHQQVTDLHLVNLAAAQGVQLATFDAAIMQWLAPADRRYVTLIPA